MHYVACELVNCNFISSVSVKPYNYSEYFLVLFWLPVEHRLFVHQGALERLIYFLSLLPPFRLEGTIIDLWLFYFFIRICVCQSFKSLNSALPFSELFGKSRRFLFLSVRNFSHYFARKALTIRQGIVAVNLKMAKVST